MHADFRTPLIIIISEKITLKDPPPRKKFKLTFKNKMMHTQSAQATKGMSVGIARGSLKLV